MDSNNEMEGSPVRGWIAGSVLAVALAGSAAADTITLANGDVIDGSIVERSGEAIVVAHEVLGRLVIPLSAVTSINGQDQPVVPNNQPGAPPKPPELPPPPSTQVVDADAAKTEAKPVAAPAHNATPANPPQARIESTPPPPKADWKQSLDIGLNLTAGNVDSRNARLQYRAERKLPENTLKFDTWYRAIKREDKATQESFSAGLFSEWPRTKDEDHNLFAQARYDFADYQPWEHRVTASGGFGWQVLDFNRQDANGNEFNVLDVTLRGGGGIRRDWGAIDEDELNPEGMVATELAWRISERQSLTATSSFYPSLEDAADYRVVNNVAWNIKLDDLEGINLKFSVNHEFDSMVPDGFEHNDLSAHAAIVIGF